MGHGEHLEATYTTQKPPWIGLWSSREYRGRPDWWKECGLKDDVVRHGKWRMVGSRYKEEDPDWYDAKVPDGTSLSGPMGLDSTRHKDLSIKADTPGDLREFQEKVMKGSHQYKAIAEKWNLSKEHPGLDVSPTMSDLVYRKHSLIGTGNFFPVSWSHLGPRFFDKPLNAAPHEKAFAAMKYTAAFMIPYTMFHIKANPPVGYPPVNFRPRMYFARYSQLAPIPLAVAGSWAFTLSFASAIRDKDDIYNQYYAAGASAFALGTLKHSFPIAITAFLVASVLGTAFHYTRISEAGLQNRAPVHSSAGHWGGPLFWKLFQRGGYEVPEKNF
ncbi:unnamed protein product, partial [Mesorhabditis spiculigera]